MAYRTFKITNIYLLNWKISMQSHHYEQQHTHHMSYLAHILVCLVMNGPRLLCLRGSPWFLSTRSLLLMDPWNLSMDRAPSQGSADSRFRTSASDDRNLEILARNGRELEWGRWGQGNILVDSNHQRMRVQEPVRSGLQELQRKPQRWLRLGRCLRDYLAQGWQTGLLWWSKYDRNTVWRVCRGLWVCI